MKFFLFFLLILSLILESSVTTLPLVFVALLVFTLTNKKNYVFLLAFIVGIIFDALSFRLLGLSSIYLTLALFLVLIYQSKFEIMSINFVLISSFVGSLGFLLFLGLGDNILFQAIFSSLIAVVLFIFVQGFNGFKKERQQAFKKV